MTSTIQAPPAPRKLKRPITADSNAPKRASILDDNPMRMVITRGPDRIVIYILLTAIGLVFAFPLYALVTKSFEFGGIDNYISLFTDPLGNVPIWATYLNSLAIGAGHAFLVVVVSTTAGYALSKLRFRGRELSFAAVLLFLAAPGAAFIVPVYYITQQLHLFNNYIGVSLPEAALTIPFGVLLMRNYGRNISDSLIEAAQLDGAGHFRIFTLIFLPLARPVIANLTILCFIWSLQDFVWPSMLFTNPDLSTAAQAVAVYSNALGRSVADTGRYNASLVLLAVPAVLFVIFGLRFIVNGLSSGSTKE